MTKSIYVAVIKMIMMPSCPYFIFIDTSISKHVDTFFNIGFRLRISEAKVGGVDMSILLHAFILILIALWAVITHYVTILMSILSYSTRFA